MAPVKRTRRRRSDDSSTKRRATLAAEIENEALLGEEDEPEIGSKGYISTGSTLLNLALTDHPEHGYPLGNMVNLIGDSSAGKTVLALTAGAELSVTPAFDDYRIIFDDVEEAAAFDYDYLFGSELARRIESPAVDSEGEPVNSSTVEDFQDHVLAALDDGRPFIYFVDSLDALTSEAEEAKAQADAEARAKGVECKGTYGMEKAKALKRILRLTSRRLKQTASTVVIISQTIDEVDPMKSRFSKKTRAGGNALRFFAVQEIWLKLKKKLKAKDRIIGAETEARVCLLYTSPSPRD